MDKNSGPLRVGSSEYLSRGYEIYDDSDNIQGIKRQRVRWLGHVVRMIKYTPALKVFVEVSASEIRGRIRAPLGWNDKIEIGLAVLDTTA